MKRSIVKILTLILALVMCLGVVACGGETAGTGTSQNPNGGENNVGDPGANASEDELFVAVKAAYENFMKFDDIITMRGIQTQTRKSSSYGDVTETAHMDVTFDFNSNRFIQVVKYYNGEEIAEVEGEKFFEKDGVYYSCAYEEEADETETEYYRYFNPDAMRQGLELDDVIQTFGSFAGGAFIADGFAELKSSFDTVIPTLLANELVYMKRDGSFKEGETMTLTPDASISRAEDGIVTLEIKLTLTASAMGEGGQEMKNVVGVIDRKFASKNGKLTSMDAKIEMNFQAPAEDGTLAENGMTMEMKFNFEHSFDEALYNSVEVSLPSNPEEIEMKFSYSDINFVLGNATYNMTVEHGVSDEWDLNDIESILSDRFNYYDPETSSYRSVITVKGLYQDAALTQKIDSDDMRLEDLLKLETVYVDYEIEEGYAIVNVNHEDQMEISRPYQIVFTQLFGYGYSSMYRDVYRAGDVYSLSHKPDRDETCKVLVNGVETAEESLTLENGKIYTVKFLSIIRDKDLGLAHVINF